MAGEDARGREPKRKKCVMHCHSETLDGGAIQQDGSTIKHMNREASARQSDRDDRLIRVAYKNVAGPRAHHAAHPRLDSRRATNAALASVERVSGGYLDMCGRWMRSEW